MVLPHKGSPKKNIARVQNCPDVTILNTLSGLCLLYFCLFFFLSFCLFVFSSFCLFIALMIKCLKGSQVSRVTLCAEILKWQWVSHPLTMVRYKAARAAKKVIRNSHFPRPAKTDPYGFQTHRSDPRYTGVRYKSINLHCCCLLNCPGLKWNDCCSRKMQMWCKAAHTLCHLG